MPKYGRFVWKKTLVTTVYEMCHLLRHVRLDGTTVRTCPLGSMPISSDSWVGADWFCECDRAYHYDGVPYPVGKEGSGDYCCTSWSGLGVCAAMGYPGHSQITVTEQELQILIPPELWSNYLIVYSSHLYAHDHFDDWAASHPEYGLAPIVCEPAIMTTGRRSIHTVWVADDGTRTYEHVTVEQRMQYYYFIFGETRLAFSSRLFDLSLALPGVSAPGLTGV